MGVLGFWALSPIASGWLWLADIAANTLPWCVVLSVVAILYHMGRKQRWKVFMAILCGVASLLWIVFVPRAARFVGSPKQNKTVHLLTYNAETRRLDAQGAIDLLHSTDADVVAMNEAPASLLEVIKTDSYLAQRYPFREQPPWKMTNTRLILSRYPLDPLIDRSHLVPHDLRRGFRFVRVHHPLGSFVLMQLHPKSPRTPDRWRKGNALVQSAVAQIRLLGTDLPIVVLADLNSTPTGSRSRYLSAQLGLARCKPMLHWQGTYPAFLPGFVELAIDDAWVSSDWRVVSWKALGSFGSDHRAVEIGLTLSQ